MRENELTINRNEENVVTITPPEIGKAMKFDMEKLKEVTPYESVVLNLQLIKASMCSHNTGAEIMLCENFIPDEIKKYFKEV